MSSIEGAQEIAEYMDIIHNICVYNTPILENI